MHQVQSMQRGLTKKGVLAQFNQSIHQCCLKLVEEEKVWRSNLTKPLKKPCFWVPIWSTTFGLSTRTEST